MNFINSFQSEWLKKKRSLASWLVIAAAFFTPSIILLSRIKNADKLGNFYASNDFWIRVWNQAWESMAVFLLPVGIILATGLVVQIEYRNNTWKQLHATPQGLSTIFFAKFLVVIVMLIEVFILFNLGMYLSAVLPSFLFSNVPFPSAPFPFLAYLYGNINFFVDCLPILALQYLISLQFKNFLVPIGVGFGIWFLGVGMLPWEFSYLLPYLHGSIDYLITSGQFKDRIIPVNMQNLAITYFVVITIVSFVLYHTKNEKG